MNRTWRGSFAGAHKSSESRKAMRAPRDSDAAIARGGRPAPLGPDRADILAATG